MNSKKAIKKLDELRLLRGSLRRRLETQRRRLEAENPEPAIARDAEYSYLYAYEILELPGSKAKNWSENYLKIGVKNAV